MGISPSAALHRIIDLLEESTATSKSNDQLDSNAINSIGKILTQVYSRGKEDGIREQQILRS